MSMVHDFPVTQCMCGSLKELKLKTIHKWRRSLLML